MSRKYLKFFGWCVLIGMLLLICVLVLWMSGYQLPGQKSFTLHTAAVPMTVSSDENRKVMVGGQSVGVRMEVADVLVVGLEELETKAGSRINPGLKAGLQIGDTILSIDGNDVCSAEEIQNRLAVTEEQIVQLKIGRKAEVLDIKVQPVQCASDGAYRLGLWVKEKTAGIGTLTFYVPQTGAFAALGHGITDPETGLIYTVGDGQLLNSKILSVKEGRKGTPGSLRGIFYEAEDPLGRLEINCMHGIYGIAYEELKNDLYTHTIEVAEPTEVKTGSAELLTTIRGSEVKGYEIQIERVQPEEAEKNMVIRVTDKTLLDESGGIIQGMSGSPILQNGKLAGAVTHVLVNHPEKGYAIFADTMLEESEKIR